MTSFIQFQTFRNFLAALIPSNFESMLCHIGSLLSRNWFQKFLTYIRGQLAILQHSGFLRATHMLTSNQMSNAGFKMLARNAS